MTEITKLLEETGKVELTKENVDSFIRTLRERFCSNNCRQYVKKDEGKFGLSEEERRILVEDCSKSPDALFVLLFYRI